MAALDAGYDVHSSGVTLDRYCGSGITAVNLAAASILAGFEEVMIAGGTELMSSYGTNKVEGGGFFIDSGNEHLRAIWPQPNQGVAADAIATLEGIPRQALDELAASSQARAATAIAEGRFDRSLVPVHDTEGNVLLATEEYPRPGTTVDKLAQLAPSFEGIGDIALNADGLTFRAMVHQRFPDLEITHVHHAGNSSGVVDGAAALLLTSPDYARAHGLTPRARIVAAANMGDDPTLMLNAPVPATRKVLAKAGMTVDQIDLFEVNEAFAVVPEKFIRDLDLDRDKVNVNGGAIALGHPIGATGAMLVGTVLDELERQDKQFGLVTMCAAGGMAPAVIIERI
jgi:acetyl-CoA C-acetyltransferase